MAAMLASQEEGLTSVTSRKRVVSTVVKDVAEALGNTPAVCRASYIDPRVIERFLNGETIELPRGRDLTDDRVRAAVESAVLDLLDPEGRSACGLAVGPRLKFVWNSPTSSVWNERHRGIDVTCGHVTTKTTYAARSVRRSPCSG